jgi:hypothetical protein
MMEGSGAGSGAGSVLVTNGSGCGSGRPKTYGSYGSGPQNCCQQSSHLLESGASLANLQSIRSFMGDTSRPSCSGLGCNNNMEVPIFLSTEKVLTKFVLEICDILVRVRIRRSVPLTNGSGSNSFLQ